MLRRTPPRPQCDGATCSQTLTCALRKSQRINEKEMTHLFLLQPIKILLRGHMCINYAKECRLPSSHRPEAVRFPLSIGRASYKSQKINNHGCTQKQHRKLKHILHLLSPARGIKKLVGTQQRFTLCSKVGTRLVATETSSPSLFSSPLKQPPSRAMSHLFLFFLFFFSFPSPTRDRGGE